MSLYDSTKYPPAAGIKSALVIGENAWRDVRGRNVGPFRATSNPHTGQAANTVDIDATAVSMIAAIPADLLVVDVECYQLWPGDENATLAGLYWHRHFAERLRTVVGNKRELGIYGFPTNWPTVVLGNRYSFVRRLVQYGEILNIFDRWCPQFYVKGDLGELVNVIRTYGQVGLAMGILGRLVPFLCPRDYRRRDTAWLPIDDWRRVLDTTADFGGRALWVEADSKEPMPDEHRRACEEAK